MPNKTIPLPHSNGHYLIGLDVFHQLHCLDSLRQSLRPERYGPHEEPEDGKPPMPVGLAHWDHCVEVIRQSLMCSVDTSPVTWKYIPGQVRPVTTTTEHVCTKWGPIKAWAEEHVQVHLRFANNTDDMLE